jgi:hypothetical protein
MVARSAASTAEMREGQRVASRDDEKAALKADLWADPKAVLSVAHWVAL